MDQHAEQLPRIQLHQESQVFAAPLQEARQVIMERDAFLSRLSPFDCAARLGLSRRTSPNFFLQFLQANVRPWHTQEWQHLMAAAEMIQPQIAQLAKGLPAQIRIIKTSGREEGGAAYTRGRTIFFPQARLQGDTRALARVLAHELFHVLSRNQPALKDQLYAAIGFHACNEIQLPSQLAPWTITNPDAPVNDHYIKLQFEGTDLFALPILLGNERVFRQRMGHSFFQFLDLRLLPLQNHEGSWYPQRHQNRIRLFELGDVTGFFEQIGRNTGYIIHPEEVLAENFAALIMQETQFATPQIPEKMKELLT